MSMSDPLGDMLARIKNGLHANHDRVENMPASRLKLSVLAVLKREGYIRGYSTMDRDNKKFADIELKYFEGKPAIETIERMSKPGRRLYSGVTELPKFRNGLGIYVLSTPQGVMSDQEARAANVGGEVLCRVY